MGDGKSGSGRRTVTVTLGGQRYRVVTSAGDEELGRLVAMVEAKAKAVGRGRGMTPDCILLTAIAFAHEAEEQRARADRILEKATGFVGGILGEIDGALLQEGDEGLAAAEDPGDEGL